MGLNVIVESEEREVLEQVADPTNILHRSLLRIPEDQSRITRYIDWYGETVFNRLQMEPFLQEWRTLLHTSVDEEERTLLETVERFAVRIEEDVHLYLRFTGD